MYNFKLETPKSFVLNLSRLMRTADGVIKPKQMDDMQPHLISEELSERTRRLVMCGIYLFELYGRYVN